MSYDTAWFLQLAERLGGRVSGQERIGLTCAAACPACGGPLLAWTYRPSVGGPAFKCDTCGRGGHIGWLRLLVRERDAAAA